MENSQTMKIRKILFALCFSFLVSSAFAETFEERVAAAKETAGTALSNVMESALNEFEVLLPESNSLMGVQPDAFIGNIFPALPPHFAVGINGGITLVKSEFITDSVDKLSSSISEMLTALSALDTSLEGSLSGLNFDINLPDSLPYPAASVSARVGGVILPFDVGLWAVTTGNIFKDKSFGKGPTLDFAYTQFGADLRYAILKGDGLFPKFTIGGGYQFVNQDIGLNFTKDFEISQNYEEAQFRGSANVTTDANLKINTHTFFGELQVSKTLLIFTPYVGLKAFFTTADCEYDWKYDTYAQGQHVDALSDSGKNSYRHTISDVGIGSQIFGGLGLNLAFFQTSFNASYNLNSKHFSASLGTNFKL